MSIILPSGTIFRCKNKTWGNSELDGGSASARKKVCNLSLKSSNTGLIIILCYDQHIVQYTSDVISFHNADFLHHWSIWHAVRLYILFDVSRSYNLDSSVKNLGSMRAPTHLPRCAVSYKSGWTIPHLHHFVFGFSVFSLSFSSLFFPFLTYVPSWRGQLNLYPSTQPCVTSRLFFWRSLSRGPHLFLRLFPRPIPLESAA